MKPPVPPTCIRTWVETNGTIGRGGRRAIHGTKSTVSSRWAPHNPGKTTRRRYLSAPGGRTRRPRHPAAPTRARRSWGQCARRAAGWAGLEAATAGTCPTATSRPPPPILPLPPLLPPPAAWCERRSPTPTRRGARRSNECGLQPRPGPLPPSTRPPPRRSGRAWARAAAWPGTTAARRSHERPCGEVLAQPLVSLQRLPFCSNMKPNCRPQRLVVGVFSFALESNAFNPTPRRLSSFQILEGDR